MDENKATGRNEAGAELPDEVLDEVAGGTGQEMDFNGTMLPVSHSARWCPYCQCETEPEGFATMGDSPYQLYWCYEKGQPYAVRK